MKCPLCYEKRLIKHVYYPDIWNTQLHSEQLNQYRHHMKPLEIYYECKDCGWIGAEPEREEG